MSPDPFLMTDRELLLSMHGSIRTLQSAQIATTVALEQRGIIPAPWYRAQNVFAVTSFLISCVALGVALGACR